ncbi:hypothetical protein B0H16DRAFT_1586361 [Mycena metata]|uniref:BTB domain-containing protein n=1 Tax=Mycena metata TaxID=1033252 RepID=A0AAD7MSA2_9AGAR|nr:hypothetical protein B0H16DRAFT_1586361 [Mycena metata]
MPNSPKRVEELWFEDGNIVLQAGDSQYRVYRGVLAARSPVFSDMLSFPQPPDSELVDGCPLVRLPDCDIEVTFFLKAIFDPEFFMPFPSRTTFETVTGCLRLSHKYEVAYLRRRALVHLTSVYDTELSRWDTASRDFDDDNAASDMISCSWPSPLAAHEIYAIELFREVGALWLLPNAFYNISTLFEKLGRDIFHETSFNGIPCSLSVEDQKSFVAGHAIQSRAVTDTLQFLTDPLNIQGCKSPTECALERFKAIGEIRGSVRDFSSDPVDVWGEDWDLLDDVCDVCLPILKKTHKAARRAFWNKLPGLYGLPPWEELEDMKVAAIGNDWIS